jgi:hypothetical protein
LQAPGPKQTIRPKRCSYSSWEEFGYEQRTRFHPRKLCSVRHATPVRDWPRTPLLSRIDVELLLAYEESPHIEA